MSALENKTPGFETSAALQDENVIREVLNYPESVSSTDK